MMEDGDSGRNPQSALVKQMILEGFFWCHPDAASKDECMKKRCSFPQSVMIWSCRADGVRTSAGDAQMETISFYQSKVADDLQDDPSARGQDRLINSRIWSTNSLDLWWKLKTRCKADASCYTRIMDEEGLT
ncbi:hypothetical protein CRENBAI_023672 [Crenichthys baileyi]|uniref:Uncharacterized protein n=1 Tax=Crenichthys baileyi TaxID=28760 RepID=A0AAV9RHV9_9TELE